MDGPLDVARGVIHREGEQEHDGRRSGPKKTPGGDRGLTTLVEETEGEKEEELVVTVCESLSGPVRCVCVWSCKRYGTCSPPDSWPDHMTLRRLGGLSGAFSLCRLGASTLQSLDSVYLFIFGT